MMVMMKNLVHHERDVVVLADLRQPSEERWRPVVVAALGLERLPGYQECLKNTCTSLSTSLRGCEFNPCGYKHLLWAITFPITQSHTQRH